MTALYDLAGQYSALANKLADADFDAQTIADTIEASGLVDEINDKAQGCELVARSLEAFNPAIDAEIARLASLKLSRANAAKGLREYIKTQMEAAGISKITAPMVTLSIVQNPPSVEIYEEGLLNARYMVQKPAPAPIPSKTIIAADLKAGIEVQGAKLTHSTRLKVA